MALTDDMDLTVASRDPAPGQGTRIISSGGSGSANPLDPSNTITTDVVPTPRADDSHVTLPDAIGGYTIVRKIGGGGQGVVFQAIQNSTRQKVALKVLPSAGLHDERSRMRIEREAQILGQINHPNVVRVHDSGSAGGCVYFAMDYISGERTLDRFLREKNYNQREKLALFARICDGVNAAHLRGVIHRDLKPSNVLVDADGAPRIVDFGLARLAAGDGNMTQTGQFLGSAPWASPEQARGIPDGLDVRTDVYSLGVILYHMLTGKHPYDVSGPLHDVLNRILNDEPARASTVIRRIDNELDTIVHKCLAKEPHRRYQSAGELARDVRHYLDDEPIEAKRDSAFYLITKSLKRYRGQVAVGVGFVVLLAAFAVGMTVAFDRAARHARQAQTLSGFLDGILGAIDPTVAQASRGTALYNALLAEVEAASKTVDEIAPDPVTEARLRMTLGRLFMNLGEYPVAREHLEIAADLSRGNFGEDDERTADALQLLGWAEKEVDDFEASEEAYEAARAIRVKRFGPNSLPVAETLNGIGQLLMAMQTPESDAKGVATLREALQIRQELRAPDKDIATSQSNLGSALRDTGSLDEADRLLTDSLALRRSALGPAHPHTVVSLNKFGLLLKERGLHEQKAGAVETAAELYRQAVDVFRMALQQRQAISPPNHPHVGVSYTNLAIALIEQSSLLPDTAARRVMLEEAAESCEKALRVLLESRSSSTRYYVSTARRLLESRALLSDKESADRILRDVSSQLRLRGAVGAADEVQALVQ